MKSTAHFKGHPIHPMLIPFPIAFFIGSLVFDALAFFTGNDGLWRTGMYLNVAGIAGALLAAVPGTIDYVKTVPPKSSAKARATKHALLNSAVVVLFAVVFFYRQDADASPYVVLGLELLGVVLMTFAGWMGGTLVYRNQIGIDPRYAYAGKWKEETAAEAGGRIAVATADELQRDQMKLVHVQDKRIVIGRTEQGYVAFDDHCSHRGGSLAGGMLICGTVQCPWHGSQFDVQTGEVKAGPAKEKITTYQVQEAEGKVYLLL